MIKEIGEWITQIITLGKETQRNSDDIKQMRRQIDEMSRAIERLAYEIKRTHDTGRHERETLAIKLENELLKFERRLPSGGSKSEE